MSQSMNQFLQFAVAHWQLFVALMLIVAVIAVFELKNQASSLMITPQAAVGWINHQQAIVVDIRAQESFAKGHIIGSKCLPAASISTALTQSEKNKPLLIVCAKGIQAEKIALSLKKEGIEKIAALKGGIESWVVADLPLEITGKSPKAPKQAKVTKQTKADKPVKTKKIDS